MIIRDPNIDIDRERVRRGGMYEFVKRAWPLVERAVPYVDNWHIEEICLHLQAITEGRLRDLVINVPPGHSKSKLVAVFWPVWAWTINPKLRWIFASFDPGLALVHAEEMFDLIRSRWYTDRFGLMLPDRAGFAMGDYENRYGGFRFSTSVGGKGTGRHAHVRVVDDPVKPADAQGSQAVVGARLLKANAWWKNTMASRAVDPKIFASVVVMQRIHENDLSGVCIEEGYTHLCLPARYDPMEPCVTPVGGDRRTIPGELLNPGRFPEEAVNKIEKSMGGRDSAIASAQLQQRPAPPGGLIFKVESFQRFDLADMPFSRTHSVISLDCTFKDKEDNDHVSIEVWGMAQSKLWCYESILGHWDLLNTIAMLGQVYRKWPAFGILVEDKANGPEVIKALRRVLMNVISVEPKTSKEERAQAANIYYAARSVYHLNADWTEGKETHLKMFPKGRIKDDVDATSQAILYLADGIMPDFDAAIASFQDDKPWQRHFRMTK